MKEVLGKNKGMEEMKISVIIPCYNQGEFLEEAVSSVLNQTYQNFEIIIINDGSSDAYTNSLLNEYDKPKTIVYRTENKGLANARNYGFSLATGDYIQFLDADDFLAPEKFEEQLEVFKKEPDLDVSYTNCQYYYEERDEYSEPLLRETLTEDTFEDFVFRWQRGLSIPIHCGLFKKDLWIDEKPFVTGFGAVEDWLMWVSIAKRGAKFKFLDRNYAFYRIQRNKRNMSKNLPHMIYWVSRAIGYMAEHYIEEKDMKRFNQEQQEYLKSLIDLYFTRSLENSLEESKKKVESKEEEIKSKEKEIKSKEEEIESKEEEIKSKEKEIKSKEEEIKSKKKEIKDLKADLIEANRREIQLLESRSYRVGNFLLWFPRKVLEIFRKALNDRSN